MINVPSRDPSNFSPQKHSPNRSKDGRKWSPLKSLIRKVYNGIDVDDNLYVLIIIEELKKLFIKMGERDFLALCQDEKQYKIQEMMDQMDPNEEKKDKLSIFKKQKVMSKEEK